MEISSKLVTHCNQKLVGVVGIFLPTLFIRVASWSSVLGDAPGVSDLRLRSDRLRHRRHSDARSHAAPGEHCVDNWLAIVQWLVIFLMSFETIAH